jgi:hypothetical protein
MIYIFGNPSKELYCNTKEDKRTLETIEGFLGSPANNGGNLII